MSAHSTDNRLQRFQDLSKDVEGFFFPLQAALWDILYTIQSQMRLSGDLMEIGVLHGKSAIMSLLSMDPTRERMDLVDLELRPTLERTMAQFSAEIRAKVNYLIGDSKKTMSPALVKSRSASYRWIHIDGEHTYDGVYSDLRNADILLQEHGLICCDDFFSPRYLQITDAVFRYVYEYPDRLCFLAIGNNKGYLCRPNAHPKYYPRLQDDLAKSMADRNAKCEVFRGMIGRYHCIGTR